MGQKSKEELAKMHWRDRYEYEAGQAARSADRRSEQELIAQVDRNNIDMYFTTFKALRKIGTVDNAAMPMWRYLQRNSGAHNMHNRYHCAEALFHILGMPDPASEGDLRKRVQWDHNGEEDRQEALLELRVIIEARQGGREVTP